jgi:hypothetical protein
MTDQRKLQPSYLGMRSRAGQERAVSAGGDPPTIRTAPRNIEAEQAALLGTILITRSARKSVGSNRGLAASFTELKFGSAVECAVAGARNRQFEQPRPQSRGQES